MYRSGVYNLMKFYMCMYPYDHHPVLDPELFPAFQKVPIQSLSPTTLMTSFAIN